MIEGRSRESLVLYDNAIEVTNIILLTQLIDHSRQWLKRPI